MQDGAGPALISLVADLVAAPEAQAEALEQARHAVAVAEATGQRADLVATPLLWRAPLSAGAVQAHSDLVGQLQATARLPERVVRRDFATGLSPDPRAGATAGAGQAPERTIGPFLDAFRRPVLVDVFGVPVRIPMQRAGAAQPFAYFDLPQPSGAGSSLTLPAGSVWIPASLLAPGVPASGFIGLRIKGGTVGLGGSVPLGVSPIVVPAAAVVTLTLRLDPASVPAGSGPGADARASHVHTPAKVTFTFAASGASLSHADGAAMGAFGTDLKLTYQALPAHFDPFFGRLDFPYTADRADFAVAVRHSTLASFAGGGSIFGAAWSLPIAVNDPGSLGAASGAGGVAVGVLPGLTAQWTGRDSPAECGVCVVLAEPGLLAVGGLTARAANVAEPITLGDNGTLRLATPGAFPFRFVSAAAGQESFAFIPLLTAALDQPRTINGARARLSGPALVVLLQNDTGTLLFIEAASAPSQQGPIESYCIKNLLLKASRPLTLGAAVTLSGTGAGSGIVAVQVNLRFVLPILPDPYATNLQFDPRRAIDTGSLGTMSIFVGWKPGQAAKIDLQLPTDAMGGVFAAPPEPAQPRPSGDAGKALADDDAALAQMQALFDRTVPGKSAGPTLLDLSSNVSQFGVAFGTVRTFGAAGPPSTPHLSISDLFLQAESFNIRLVTLPAVQWEPVLTPDPPPPLPFPGRLTFPDSGQTTELAAFSVALVPIAPRPAIDALLGEYNTASAPVAARFTLPFGIAAVAELRRSNLPFVRSPSLSEVQPSFGAAGLKGGDQISIQAAHPIISLPGSGSPSLPGAAVQLHNARSLGVPTPINVLTPIDDTFNGNFGPAAAGARVPVTRIDISGFGESLFSDWRNSIDDAAVISKAKFEVIAGRTGREVVQAYSVKYPYAVRVVRTITIERQNGAAIVRHDSGWQPVGDGVYRYPHPGLVTHPGVVRAAVAVSNIRDTGQRHTTPDGTELMAVRFDCALTMEGAVLGAGPDGVPARDQLGYVQLTNPHGLGQLAPDQYAELLQTAGPLGGAVDCTLDIGGTGQRMRVTHVSAGSSPGMGGPEFVMAAWGSPVLPGGGQWSVLRQGVGDQAPVAVSQDQGVPLVRAGPAPAAPPAAAPYRFADPADLLHPDSPDADYGLLHATGTQRLLFPRPKLETSGPHAVSSVRPPVLADPFALATATGPFPRVDACIPFPNANYALEIGAGGNLRLQPGPFQFTTAPALKRVLRDSTTIRSIAYTADEHNTPAVVTIAIDTAAADPWSVNITNLSLATESGTIGEVTRVVGTIDSKPGVGTQLIDARLVFGPPLAPAAALISFLENFGPLPPPGVSMTNDWSLQSGLTFDLQKLLSFMPIPIGKLVKAYVVDLDVKMLSKTAAMSSSFIMQFELTIKVPTPFSTLTPDGELEGLVAIGLAKIQFQMSDETNAWTFQLGAGIGVAFPVAKVFDAIAYYAQSMFFITGDFGWGVGSSSLVKGSIDLKVIEIGLSLEAKVALVKVNCGAGSSIWGVAQVTIAVEISIFFVIDIEVDWQTEWTNDLDGGPCPLPDVV